jgi:hypothetical protein
MVLLASTVALAADVRALLHAVVQAGPENRGRKEAQVAYEELSRLSPADLPQLLVGLDGANPIAANWIRCALDTIVERAGKEQRELPVEALKEFLEDRSHNPRARRLAYELIVQVEPSSAKGLLSTMLEDPSLELRRDAVDQVLSEAKGNTSSKSGAAAELFETALKAARDEDQVRDATAQLKKLGRTVNLPRHFGLLMQWKLVGPFDNPGMKGFNIAYPPEAEIDLAAEYQGKEGSIRWMDHTTKDDYGNVDLNAVVGKKKGAAAYALAEFVSDKPQIVDLRLGCMNANKIWLNGKLVHSAEVYHTGIKLDQYIAKGELKSGVNQVLIKICQNEQNEEWAQEWRFQLRICDETGTAVLSTDRVMEDSSEVKR